MTANIDPADVLMQPIKLGSLEIKNRIVAGPMAVLAPQEDGRPSAQTIAYLSERAKGGVGMIIAGAGVPNPRAAEEVVYRPIARAYTDDCVPDLKRVADAVHAHGVPIFAEIVSGFGRMSAPKEGQAIASSAVPLHIPEEAFPLAVPGGHTLPTPREATVEEIRQRVAETAHSASLIKRAGWDGIELAAHMSYFESSFLTPRINKRTDEYGGSVENRARILVEMVRGIRGAVGPDTPISLRITCNEHVEGGQGAEGYAAIAQVVEREAGGLAYVALSAGCYESMQVGLNSKLGSVITNGDAKVFKSHLNCPIMMGGLHDPYEAAEAITGGHGDIAMMARPLLADPNYANKVKDRRYADIVQCDEDNYCIRRLMLNVPMRCALNPRMGLESTDGAPPAKRMFEVPVEQLKLAVATSKPLMRMAAALRKPAH